MVLGRIGRAARNLLARGFERTMAIINFGAVGTEPIAGSILSQDVELPIEDTQEIANLVRDGLDAAIEIERSPGDRTIDLDLIPVNPYLNDLHDLGRIVYSTNVEVTNPDSETTANIRVDIPTGIEMTGDELREFAEAEAIRRITLSPKKFGFDEAEQIDERTLIQVVFVEREF